MISIEIISTIRKIFNRNSIDSQNKIINHLKQYTTNLSKSNCNGTIYGFTRVDFSINDLYFIIKIGKAIDPSDRVINYWKGDAEFVMVAKYYSSAERFVHLMFDYCREYKYNKKTCKNEIEWFNFNKKDYKNIDEIDKDTKHMVKYSDYLMNKSNDGIDVIKEFQDIIQISDEELKNYIVIDNVKFQDMTNKINIMHAKNNIDKKFTCIECNYGTDEISNINKHNKTKKHLVRTGRMVVETRKFICEYCKQELSTLGNLKTHIGRCKLKDTDQNGAHTTPSISSGIRETVQELKHRLDEQRKEFEKKREEFEKKLCEKDIKITTILEQQVLDLKKNQEKLEKKIRDTSIKS